MHNNSSQKQDKVKVTEIFPWFILGFLVVVGIKSSGLLPESFVGFISDLSKFLLATALGAIGLKTSFKEVAGVGIRPMIAAVVIDTSVVIVSLLAQAMILS